MSQMRETLAPTLHFATSEYVANGVTVNPIDFAKIKKHPPFNFTYFEVQPGCMTPLDKHRVEECWVIMQGSGLLHYENQSHAVKTRDVLHFASNKKHQIHNDAQEPLIILSIYW